jgi:hypothetical protein
VVRLATRATIIASAALFCGIDVQAALVMRFSRSQLQACNNDR